MIKFRQVWSNLQSSFWFMPSIQASSIIASVAEETISSVDRLFPGSLEQVVGNEDDEQPARPPSDWKWQPVKASESGYIQSVDNDFLLFHPI